MGDLSATELTELTELLARVETEDPYLVLGLQESADADDIKHSYYALSRRYHPDRFYRREVTGHRDLIEAVFTGINQSYEILASDTLRRRFDLERARGERDRLREEAQDESTRLSKRRWRERRSERLKSSPQGSSDTKAGSDEVAGDTKAGSDDGPHDEQKARRARIRTMIRDAAPPRRPPPVYREKKEDSRPRPPPVEASPVEASEPLEAEAPLVEASPVEASEPLEAEAPPVEAPPVEASEPLEAEAPRGVPDPVGTEPAVSVDSEASEATSPEARRADPEEDRADHARKRNLRRNRVLGSQGPSPDKARQHHEEGKREFEAGNFIKAASSAYLATTFDSSNVEYKEFNVLVQQKARNLRSMQFVNQAENSENFGNWREAQEFYQKAVDCEPEEGLAYFRLAQLLVHKADDSRGAMSNLRQAVLCEPDNHKYRTALAELYVLVDMPRNAEREYQRVLEKDPKNAKARQGLRRTRG